MDVSLTHSENLRGITMSPQQLILPLQICLEINLSAQVFLLQFEEYLSQPSGPLKSFLLLSEPVAFFQDSLHG